MMKKIFLLLFLVQSLHFLGAQNNKQIVIVLPLSQIDSGNEETRTLEILIKSYVSEIEGVQLLESKDSDTANYLIRGSLSTVGDNRELNLEIMRVQTGEKKSVTIDRRNMSDLVLGIRSLVQELFGLRSDSISDESTLMPLTENLVYGTWHGDKGIELVRIYKGGRAAAIFSSGVRMDLSYSISKGEITLTQVSPNTERYYYPVPYKVATELVKVAQPMQWILHPLTKGAMLRGVKISSAVRYDDDTILELIHNSSREAEWTRADR